MRNRLTKSWPSRAVDYLLADHDNYEFLDWPLTVRVGGVLWLVSALAFALVLPTGHPTNHVGQAGWVVVGGMFAVAMVCGWLMTLRPSMFSPLRLLGMGYLAAAGIGVAQALIGIDAPFELGFLLMIVYHGFVHPARRVVPLVIWTLGVETASTLVNHPSSLELGGMLVTILLVLLMIAIVMVGRQTTRSLMRELVRLRRSAERLAMVDPLTQLGNRRAFEQALHQQVMSSRRYQRPISVAIADVDKFKAINDEFGHAAGDEVLVAVGRTIARAVRSADMAFRWGGDEFVVVLPESDLQAAEHVVERMVEMASRDVHTPDKRAVSITCGAASLREDEDISRFMQRADQLLYERKQRRGAGPVEWQTSPPKLSTPARAEHRAAV